MPFVCCVSKIDWFSFSNDQTGFRPPIIEVVAVNCSRLLRPLALASAWSKRALLAEEDDDEEEDEELVIAVSFLSDAFVSGDADGGAPGCDEFAMMSFWLKSDENAGLAIILVTCCSVSTVFPSFESLGLILLVAVNEPNP